ncbi:hypothetical protein Acr_15g0005640 [Actinidia rufa]|uniref:U1-type domain-containing protein n=1 Tax=Actinidia rufa TaxID=165716 RepID=A0A7J0FTC7_9ERIC|nr:hypothetical protein Acr_15g0005640 [Actinidia rufa]
MLINRRGFHFSFWVNSLMLTARAISQESKAGQSLYRGGGRRGGGQFRGSNRGNFGNRPPRSSGTGQPSHWRGRGRGRAGPGRFPPNGASSSSQPKASAIEEAKSSEENAEPTADNSTMTLKQESAALNKRPPQAAWCELCRVDCTSFEILEQHKNGKKHKKNLQRLEELQSASKPVSVAGPNPEIGQEVVKDKQTLPENLTTESSNGENKVEAETFNVEENKTLNDPSRGSKRKMRGGRGGKRMKTSDGLRRPVEPPKPKVVIPLICDLCNVKCDTREVFDRHLAGKKHISKLKRYEGHQAMYGPQGLQALYPPNPIAQSLLHPQGPQQHLYGPQGSCPPPGSSYVPPRAHHPSAKVDVSGCQANPNQQASGTSSNFNGHEGVHEVQQHSALVVTETKQNDLAAQT